MSLASARRAIAQRATSGAAAPGRLGDSVNTLIGDLVQPTSEVARVIGAVAKGDLSRRWRSTSRAGR